MAKTTKHLPIPHLLPLVPLRDIVVFPQMVVSLVVGRQKSIRALEEVLRIEEYLLLVTQKDPKEDNPSLKDLFEVGTIAKVLQIVRLQDGTVKLLVEGQSRIKIGHLEDDGVMLKAAHEALAEEDVAGPEVQVLAHLMIERLSKLGETNRTLTSEVIDSLREMILPTHQVDAAINYLALRVAEKQTLLEILSVKERLEKVLEIIEQELGALELEKRIQGRVRRQIDKSQREYYLNEQMKAIQKELHPEDEGNGELVALEKTINTLKMTKEARERALAELKKLRTMSPTSAEASIVRSYLDWLTTIPWSAPSKTARSLARAQKVLDHDHYGLEKVKERILEHLAVQLKTKNKAQGQILCLVGPPGVGKTSLARSIAQATNRQFVRISLGGLRDEAEIRGHRRTYIGAMPGKIIQSMKKVKTSTPLFLLDEIDKMGMDWRGDPSSALLEVLDPEQNKTFNDLYLEVDYDLSQVMFITTANTLNMPRPLLDRMEIIYVPGYTEEEKMQIAHRHLLKKQMEACGLKSSEISISQDTIRDIIRYYTRESGVRNLERQIGGLMRKATKKLLLEKEKKISVTHKNLEDFLGKHKYRFGLIEAEHQVGITTGLAWTEVGGDILLIEVVTVPGKGKITITGKLGDVMQESVRAALSYIRSRAHLFGIDSKLFETRDIHLHAPEGATPKDGPSAGIAICTSIVSAMTGIPVRRDIAMTGEITLRGRVLPIGGLREKLLAAKRAGITTVLIPEENKRELDEIKADTLTGLEIILVNEVQTVLEHALTKPLVPQPLPIETPLTETQEVMPH